MTAAIHRCDGMRELEELGALVGDLVRSIPRAVSVTRLGAADAAGTPYATEQWVLQLCAAGGQQLLVCVSYCPFCGANLSGGASDEKRFGAVADMLDRLSR